MIRSVTVFAAIVGLASATVHAGPRARDLGIPFDGKPGTHNAITDVPNLAVGYTTLNVGTGEHAVRTGVTAVLPRGRATLNQPVFAGLFSLNGNGEMTGSHWIEEAGLLEGPLLITNTHSVGVVRDATIKWRVKQGSADASGYWWSLPVVAETWDGDLNDINGFHIKPQHVFTAIESAKGGAIAEGNVGGGTGMICHEFKGGTGTSSRVLDIDGKKFTVGALVQANYGVRSELRIAGVPVGRLIEAEKNAKDKTLPRKDLAKDQGSIIIAVGTDIPLLPHQLNRLARRAALGLARNGSYAGNGSGDIFLAFSTANDTSNQATTVAYKALGNEQLDAVFLATVQAVEESVINALIAAETMTGVNGNTVEAIDHKLVQKFLKQHGRLNVK
jgi:D-aminopeptidase